LISVINGLTAYDVDTQSGSILTGDGTVRNLESNLRNLVNTSVQNAFTDYSTLASLGITTNTVDGNLKLDATKLNTALTADQDNVAMVFASFAKATNSSVEFVSSTSATVEGAYRVVGTDTSTSGVLTAGAAISEYSYNGGANNGTFTIEIDGVATDVLLNNNDSSAEDVRADIQSQLSGVTVSLSSDILIFTSQSTGSSSTVEITAANTNAINGLGISVTAGTAGVTSASYTINGEAATIEDNVITGALGTAVEGLSLKILGNAVGDLGSVIYSHGIASQLDTFITNLLVDDGMIDARLDGIASSITDIGAQRLSLDLRAIALEKQYRLQFNNLETLIAQLNTTQSFLTTALSQFIEPLSFRK
jgi:flagellar hook-associated protein 2